MSFGETSPPTLPYRLKLIQDFGLGLQSRLGLFSTDDNADLLTSKSWGVLLMAVVESILYESKMLSTAGLAAITEKLYAGVELACNTQQLNSMLVKSVVFVNELLKLPDIVDDISSNLHFLTKVGRQLLRIPEQIGLFRRDTHNIRRVILII